jgi:hypothetical protein
VRRRAILLGMANLAAPSRATLSNSFSPASATGTVACAATAAAGPQRDAGSAISDVLHVAHLGDGAGRLPSGRIYVGLTGGERFLWFTFERGLTEKVVAIRLADAGANPPDNIAEVQSDLTLSGMRAREAWIVDLMNGTEQEVVLTRRGTETFIQGMRVKVYPAIIRLIDR